MLKCRAKHFFSFTKSCFSSLSFGGVLCRSHQGCDLTRAVSCSETPYFDPLHPGWAKNAKLLVKLVCSLQKSELSKHVRGVRGMDDLSVGRGLCAERSQWPLADMLKRRTHIDGPQGLWVEEPEDLVNVFSHQAEF